MKSKILLFYLFVFQIIFFNSCVKGIENSSDIDSLLSFGLNFDPAKNRGLNKEDISINIDPADSTKISVVLPYKKRELITKLVPTIKFVGKKIEPDPITIKDFSKPVAFIVTPEKGEAKTYTVTVSVSEPRSQNKILSFSIKKPDGVKAKILTNLNEDNSSISISLTDLSYYDLEKAKNIVSSIEISEFASISDNSKIIDLSTIPTEALKYTVTAENGETKEYTVNITHELKKFISKWKTTSSSKQIQLPIYSGGNYDFTVDWGDGTEKQKVSSHDITNASHTYKAAGDYIVTITGKIDGFNFSMAHSDSTKIIAITSWGDLKFGSNQGRYFKYCSELKSLPSEAPNLEGITEMGQMFEGATSFNSNISSWDVSKITNMEGMFDGAKAFNSNISNWDVSNVTNMGGMFSYTDNFNQDISGWNVSNVTEFSGMFNSAKAFNQDLSSWKVQKTTDITDIFNDSGMDGDNTKYPIPAN
ncbi:BspA family leucine-rich repeat surface protein [Ichthyobacterium seriolicida]|uniref:PKD domain-containing protein n=1 Tax=Ichthyobacterium seriolicida TaxID=242600 RepID=A0A1J1EAE6_9FLAO|nr:BspA family leucine-rich repeat surface protein [Ichthyobacterium seriolicida]BAV94907.1 hypothetical protein JBKA6_0894 [Ichthyobacterium seriolicida]